ncbi:MAG TPA: polysaccharide lyase family protein, partial [Phycisphaerae bacterium]|nr:polysaccharide lyase family protein [Phycisphaerae bacterium]
KESRTPEGLWQEALAKEKEEEAKWPYGWVNGVDYPHAAERGAAEGQIVLDDRQGGGGAGGGRLEHLRVGLTHADYVTAARPASAGGQGGAGGVGRQGGAGGGGRPGGAGRFNAGPQNVTWQNDAKFYEFWVRGDEAGHFSIPAVRAGRYTLHAIADNVLGEFAEADVTVEAGKTVELGKVVWKPVRFGQQVWEIGKPDRTADEFKNGDIYNSWGLYNKYAEEFPNDVTFVIGKSDPKTDWNLMEVPHRVGTTGYQGRETTWTVVFEMDHVPTGGATLRLAFAGTEARSLSVGVNGKEAGQVTGLMNTSVIHRDADRSYWQERDVKFPGTMLQKGTNRITLTVPAGSTTAGVEYDYLRLEVEG